MAEVLTVRVRGGMMVLAREDKRGVWPVTYANLTQARRKAEELGAWELGRAGWGVTARHPFLVAFYSADGSICAGEIPGGGGGSCAAGS